MDTKNTKKTFLVWDSGGFSELANGLGKHGDKVIYFTPSTSDFLPKFSDHAIGKGYEHLEKPDEYFWDWVDKADCIVNFDVHGNDKIAYLRKHFPDKPTFGSGKGEKLENNRWGLKKVLKEIGMKVQKSQRVKGVTELKNLLQKEGDKFVKIDIYRGSVNSFYAKNYDEVKQLLTDIEYQLGPFKEEFYFVVEDCIDSDQEWGVDTFFAGGDYCKPFMYGIELSKDCYIGRVSDYLPPQLMDTMTRFKPVLKQLDWRGCISTEEKIVNKTEHYFLDICARSPSPLGILYPEFIDNWPEAVYAMAQNNNVRLKIKHKYVCCVPLYSHHSKDSWVKLTFNPKDRTNIKLATGCKYGNDFYAVKGSDEGLVAVVIGGGQTVKEATEQCKDYCGKVDCYGMEKSAVSGLDDITKIVQDASKYGIEF
jgi:hypothetical protein